MPFDTLCRIPFVLNRSGTSRGLYLLEKDVPSIGPARNAVLSELMGSGHPQQIGGFGGGCGPTSKVAIVGPHKEPGWVTCYFSQCGVTIADVDTSAGDCGNILAAVGGFAIENNLVAAETGDKTRVKVESLNTGARYEVDVPMSAKGVQYTGSFCVPGVPGPAAPVRVATRGVAGAQTGRLLPTGQAEESFDLGEGLVVRASIIDFARALVMVDAADIIPHFGYSNLQEVTLQRANCDHAMCSALEKLRLQASQKMGMGDCTGKDAPKLALVAPLEAEGRQGLACRYFVNPGRSEMHPTIAMTAAQAVGAASLLHGSVAMRALGRLPQSDSGANGASFTFEIQHEKGNFPVSIGTTDAKDAEPMQAEQFATGLPATGLYVTTVMPIAQGSAFLKGSN
ncbi:unnamed protein product [Effrenium voratum]|nr:unnamed protein product [Effrenium voratum]